MTEERHLGETIRQIREEKGITLAELAGKCPLSVEMLEHIETGQLLPSLAPLMKIARALGVRALFPVHKFDNAFGPGDGDRNVGQIGSFINSGHYSNMVTDCPASPTVFDRGPVTFGGLNRPRMSYLEPAPNDMSMFGVDPIQTVAPFLGDLQAGDGGLRAHDGAPAGDLLSTFVGLTALAILGALARVDRAAVARFVKAAGVPFGGFRESPNDDAPDVEYTYYGIGTLALLGSRSDA